jgi:hypothetical protein
MNPKFCVEMPKAIKIIRCTIILIIIALFTGTGCASTKKNTFYSNRGKASHISTTQLGRNKYYFSTGYQKKLTKKYKK